MTDRSIVPEAGPGSAAADWSLIAVPGVIWGASFLFIAEGLRAVSPMGVSLVRIAVGFASVALFKAAWKPIERKDWPAVAWLGVLWLAFPLSMFPFAEQRISSALAGMLNGAVPLSAAAIATIIARKLPPKPVLAGLAVGLLGAVFMALPSIGEPSSTAGVLMVVAAVISYGFAPNIARPLQQKYGALPVIWRAQAVALVLVLPLGIGPVAHAHWSLVPVLSLLALGALGTGVAHVIMTTASGRLGATRASATAFLIPPVALLLGVLVRGEHVALLSVIGGAVCVAGAWIMRRANAASVPQASVPRLVKAAVAAALLLVARPSLAQQLSSARAEPGVLAPNPAAVLPLTRLSGPIVVDGRSDDAAWQNVAPLQMNVYLPTFGSVPSERTVARVGYDDDNLYVMIDAWESHPGGVRGGSMIRDDDAPGDFINVLMDNFGDRQNAVNFSTTPGGQRNDWTISNDAQSGSNLSPAWNAVWDLKVVRGAEGWHAEYRIPFSTLRFTTNDGRVEFGFSVNRLVAHSNERQTFPSIEPNSPLALWKPSRFQRVSIENIHPGRSVRLTPYVTAGVEGLRAPDPTQSPWSREETVEGGGDLKMALTPNMTLDLTANTDFAETEVDDERVNLTRFALFYPERRAFFVERAGTFEVHTAESDLLFNSRRVGLTDEGDVVRILAGARVVGRISGWDVGMFDAQTGRTPAGSHENLGVLRLRRGVFNNHSWLGMMVTSRVTPDSAQAGLAADGDVNLGGDDYLSFAAAMLAGDLGLGPDSGFVPGGSFRVLAERRRNLGVWYRATVASIGARYAPALGYVNRGNAILPSAELGYGRVVSASGRQMRVSAFGGYAYGNASGDFEGSTSIVTFADQEPGGTVWSLSGTRAVDELGVPFNPVPGTSVPVGQFNAVYAQLSMAPSNGPRLAIGGAARAGEYYDGTLYSLNLAPEWRASANFRIGGEVEVDRIEFASRNELAWTKLARLKVLASASTHLMLSAVIQANTAAKVATANIRLRYNVEEGHDLWIVYGENNNLDRDRLTPTMPGVSRATLLIKYTRSFGQ